MTSPGAVEPILLGVNIDHVATIRQNRLTDYPDPIRAAAVAERAGADAITLHLREDRRHIQDSDLQRLRRQVGVRMNLEMAITDEMLRIAAQVGPDDCCLVPERREELTTEGGLDVVGNLERVRAACATLADAGIRVSLFIDPTAEQVRAAQACGAPVVELHTGSYAEARDVGERGRRLAEIEAAARLGRELGLQVNAGHGLTYDNVGPIAAMPELRELNIGHAIVAEAIFRGLDEAVREMQRLMREARER